jgi:hypothetical protein
MSRAERLYLYLVSGVSLSMWAAAAIIALRLILKEIGVGPQETAAFSSDSVDRDMWSVAIGLGLVGFVVWAFHWMAIDRSVRPSGAGPAAAKAPKAKAAKADAPEGQPIARFRIWAAIARSVRGLGAGDDKAADVAERRSIIRSFYLSTVMGIALVPPIALAAQLAGRALADVMDMSATSAPDLGNLGGLLGTASLPSLGASSIGDDWSLAIIVVFAGIWAYHAWVRGRDVRQGPVITGAAAWVSRLYLYWAAYVGLAFMISNAASFINLVLREVAGVGRNELSASVLSWLGSPLGSPWPRAGVMVLVAVALWGAVWLGHWLYSDRLRTGTTEQSAEERTSRVRLAFLVWIAVYGASAVLSGVALSLSVVFDKVLDANLYPEDVAPLWYNLVTPTLAVVFAALAWWWHRRRALAEDADGPVGVSAVRVTGYAVALVGLANMAIALAMCLGSIFGEWFVRRYDIGSEISFNSFDYAAVLVWQPVVAIYGAIAVVALAIWLVPWFFAQRRRAAEAPDRALEIGSSSRAYYLFSIAAAAIVVVALALAMILYRYMRATFGLPEENLGSEVSGPLGWLVVAGVVFAYHRLVVVGWDREAS